VNSISDLPKLSLKRESNGMYAYVLPLCKITDKDTIMLSKDEERSEQ